MRTIIMLTVVAFLGCGTKVDLNVNAPDGVRKAKVIQEAYLSQCTRPDNIDSPAFWHGPSGEHWIVATAKATDCLVVYDAINGKEIKRTAGPGKEQGMLKRPNGVLILENMALVVERDNHRVQIFSLPEFEVLGVVGEADLRRPYGLYAYSTGPDSWRLFVSDDYETAGGDIPPDSELGERIKIIELLRNQDGSVSGSYTRFFGQTAGGDGVLNVVESLWGDPEHNVLMVADEEDNVYEIYDLEGNYTGRALGKGLFKFQTEGIVLVDCGDGQGWWIASDQGEKRTVFHVFERRSFGYTGSFAGQVIANTDGVALTQQSFGSFEGGALVAVHDDGGIGTFALNEIARNLGISLVCNPAN